MSAPDYAFPNISFRESVVGPSPIRRPWRDRIGVAAKFRRGPEGPVEIDNRQDFVYLFGEDTSPGSLFIQQAMSQGATHFTIARAIPMPSEASVSLVISNSNSALPPAVAVEGTTQDTTNWTTGLTLNMSYVGKPYVINEPAAMVESEDVADISHTSFRGRALMRYYVLGHAESDSSMSQIGSASASVKFMDGEGVEQVILISKTQANVADFIANLKPGTLIIPTASIDSSVKVLRVMSEPFSNDANNYGVVAVLDTIGNSSASLSAAVDTSGGSVASISIQGANFAPAAGDTFILQGGGGTVHTIGTSTAGGSAGQYTLAGITPAISSNYAIGTRLVFQFTEPTPPVGTAPQATQVATLHKPDQSAYILGYRLESIDGGDLSEAGTPSELYMGRKFYLSSRPDIAFDGFNLVADSSGGAFVPMSYFVINNRANVSSGDAYELTSKGLNVNLKFSPEGGGSSSLIGLRVGGEFYVPFARSSVTIGGASGSTSAFVARTPASDILAQLEEAIFNDAVMSSMLEDSTLAIDIPPYSLTLKTTEKGEAANRLRWTLSRLVAGTSNQATDLILNGNITNYGVTNRFIGGSDGPRLAYRDFYSVTGEPLLRIVARSPGTYGNKLKIDITPDAQGRFQLTVTDEDSRQFLPQEYSESFLLDNQTIDRQSGVYPETLSSKIIRAFFIPALEAAKVPGSAVDERLFRLLPLRLAPPFEVYNSGFGSGEGSISSQGGQILKGVYLRGGTDTPPNAINAKEIEVRAQTEAVRRLESSNLAILGLPGAIYGDSLYQSLFAEAKAQVERSTAQNGLRIAVFDGPSRMGARQAYALSDQIDSPRVVLLAGYQTYRGQQAAGFNAVPSSGTYAGALVVRPPHISPPSTYGGFLPRGVISVDTNNSPQFLDTLTRGRTEALHYDGSLEAYKFLNGLTTATDTRDRYVSVRRIMDQIVSDLYDYLQWVRSEPNTRSLQKRVAAACDAYLIAKMTEDYLVRVANTICGPENNTVDDMLRGILNIRIRVTPVFPADFIRVDLVRDLTSDFSLNTANA